MYDSKLKEQLARVRPVVVAAEQEATRKRVAPIHAMRGARVASVAYTYSVPSTDAQACAPTWYEQHENMALAALSTGV